MTKQNAFRLQFVLNQEIRSKWRNKTHIGEIRLVSLFIDFLLDENEL